MPNKLVTVNCPAAIKWFHVSNMKCEYAEENPHGAGTFQIRSCVPVLIGGTVTRNMERL